MELKEEDKLLTNDMAEGQSQNVHIQNDLFNKTGKLIPCSTICQITLQKRQIVKKMDFKGMLEHKNNDDISPIEYMIKYC